MRTGAKMDIKPGMAGGRFAAGRADAGVMRLIERTVRDRFEALHGMAKVDKEERRRRNEKELRWKTGKDEPLREKLHREAKEADGALARMRRRVFESCAHAQAAMMEGIMKQLGMKAAGPDRPVEPEHGRISGERAARHAEA